MKMASYEDAWLRENDQTHRPGLNSTFLFTVRIDIYLQIQLQVQPFHNQELELELIQSHMAQKPMLRGEVGARALRVRSDVRGHLTMAYGAYFMCSGDKYLTC